MLAALQYGMPADLLPPDAFGDRFDLADLTLSRPAAGYAVQMLDTDTLLDKLTGTFLSVRSAALNGLFDSFDAAHAAAGDWVRCNTLAPHEHKLAIVPAAYDVNMQRHVLIYGVLCGQP